MFMLFSVVFFPFLLPFHICMAKDARAALFAWFRVPGVYTGHTEENFGPEGLQRANEFRDYVPSPAWRVGHTCMSGYIQPE